MRVLTPNVVRKVRALAKSGVSQAEIATRLGISKGSVHSALAGGTPKAPAVASAASGAARSGSGMTPGTSEDENASDGQPAPPPPSMSEQLSWLARTVAHQHARAVKLAASGDDAGAARASRDGLTAQSLLARHTPPTPPSDDDDPDMVALAEQVAVRLRKHVNDVLGGPPAEP